MKQKGKLHILFQLSLICLVFWNLKPIWGQDVKFVEKIELSPSPLPGVWDFCVTDDELFIIPDYQAGNVKVYEKNKEVLELVKIIGRKGYGPDEFARPSFCFYSKDESKFGVMDQGIRKIFIYDRIGRIEFKRVKEVSCWRGAYDIQLKEKKLFISGYTPDPNKRHYDFYYIDLTNNETTFLLLSHFKFGFKSSNDFGKQFKEKHIPAIGLKGWFDIYRDDAYFVWEGNLRIIKINIVSGDIEPKPFGKKLPHYIKPYESQILLKSHKKRDPSLTANEKSKMSYVKNIFVNSKYVIIIYKGTTTRGRTSIFRMQFYTLDGDFIREVSIPDQPDLGLFLDKDKNILYSLASKSQDEDLIYYLTKYELN